jgi:hypothetical protein
MRGPTFRRETVDSPEMKPNQARHLGELAGRFYSKLEDYTDTQVDEIIRAIMLQARDYLPDGSISAVIEQDEGVPLVLAATDSHIYALDVESVEDDWPAITRCRLLRLDPASCSASVAVRYGGSHRFGVGRRIVWTFHFRDTEGTLDAKVPGRLDPEGEMDERARLGQHLAVRLGWDLPHEASPGSAA